MEALKEFQSPRSQRQTVAKILYELLDFPFPGLPSTVLVPAIDNLQRLSPTNVTSTVLFCASTRDASHDSCITFMKLESKWTFKLKNPRSIA
jgi:hypothetical protein